MGKPLDVLATGKMGVNRAVMEFNALCTSLKDRVGGRVCDGCSIAPQHYLSYEEGL